MLAAAPAGSQPRRRRGGGRRKRTEADPCPLDPTCWLDWPQQVRLPEDVREGAVWDLPSEVIFDCRRTATIADGGFSGLIGAARRQPVRLLLTPGSPLLRKLRAHFSTLLKGGAESWLLDLRTAQ